MPSVKTRVAYQSIAIAVAQDALVEASAAVSSATDTLENIEAGTLDLEAITVGGVRFGNNGGVLEPIP